MLPRLYFLLLILINLILNPQYGYQPSTYDREKNEVETPKFMSNMAPEHDRIKQKPAFTIPPRRVLVYANEPARFECAVTVHPKPKISWFINGRLIVTVRFSLLKIWLE